MNIEPEPSIQEFIDGEVKAGRFRSAKEVLEAGVTRLMREPDVEPLDEETMAAIERSEAEIERGEVLDWKDVQAQLRREYLGE